MDVEERIRLLRAAVADEDAEDFGALANALAGATEEERAEIAAAVPPLGLLDPYEPTPGAAYVLAALGAPDIVANAVVGGRTRRTPPVEIDRLYRPLTSAVVAGAVDRDETWLRAFVDRLPADNGTVYIRITWPIAFELTRARSLDPASAPYLRLFLRRMLSPDDGSVAGWDRAPDAVEARLRAVPDRHVPELLALFATPGMGANASLRTGSLAEVHDRVMLEASLVSGESRRRFLDDSLASLGRGLSAYETGWYPKAHRALEPTPEEIVARQDAYLALLGAEPSTVVGLAQEMLERAIRLVDADALLAASSAVLARPEKKLVNAQLGLLKELARLGRSGEVSALVQAALDGFPPDVRTRAERLIVAAPAAPADDAPASGGSAPGGRGEAVAVPGPRRAPLAEPDRALPPLADDAAFRDALARQLDGSGSVTELPPVLARLRARPEAVPASAIAAAEEILPPEHELRHDARILLAGALLGRLGDGELPESLRTHRVEFSVLHGDPIPEGGVVTRHVVPENGGYEFDWGHVLTPDHSLPAVFAEQFAGEPELEPIPRTSRAWRRVLREPGEGWHPHERASLGEGPKPLWETPDEGPVPDEAPLTDRVRDVDGLDRVFTFRAEMSRPDRPSTGLTEWAAWLLSRDVDTLAAQFHPVLVAATVHANVRGIGAITAAIGAAATPPEGPAYSALALALSAKAPGARADAAAAVAALAGSGLLDPDAFAAEALAHLSERFVTASRLVEALDAAASASAIAGYRVLQMLEAMLPRLAALPQPGRFLELAARLSSAYGTPVGLPPALAAKRGGSSVLAVAVRALEEVVPRSTALAERAAAEAADALATEGRRAQR